MFTACDQNTLLQIPIPKIAGVSTPSPITMQVPIKDRTSNTLCSTLSFSNTNFKLDLTFFLLVGPVPYLVYSIKSFFRGER